MNDTLYFDWAASSPADEDILNESYEIAKTYFANPSSIHTQGVKAREKLEEARTRAAKALGVKPQTLIFTSGGTESDWLPIVSLLQRPVRGSIIVSAIEHPAVKEQAMMMKHCGWKVIEAGCDASGIVQPENVIEKIQHDTALVCIMTVNNETGAVQPIYDIADALIKISAGKKKPKFHVDAVQAAGKIPLTLSYPGIDSASFSAHKIGGPRGIGLLYTAVRQEPFLRGGGQEDGLRSGTENLAGAWAISRCLERYAVQKNSESYARYLKQIEMTAAFIQFLQSIPVCSVIPSARSSHERAPDSPLFSPWIVQASFAGVPGEVMVRALAAEGVSISTGSACSARKLNRPVLEAMHISQQTAANAVRFSFGHKTSAEDIIILQEKIMKILSVFHKGL